MSQFEQNIENSQSISGVQVAAEQALASEALQIGRVSDLPSNDVKDETLTTVNFADIFERNKDRLDADQNDYISEDEIDMAIMDPSYTGADAELLYTLKNRISSIEEFSNDEYGDENDGITSADVAEYSSWEQRNRLHIDAQKLLTNRRNFGCLDDNKDGIVDFDEIEAVLNQHRSGEHSWLNAGQLNGLEFARDNYDQIAGADGKDGLTIADWTKYSDSENHHDERQSMSQAISEARSKTNEISAGNRKLFADESDPLNSITPDAVTQQLGDCYFLSAVTSLASTEKGKQAIADMIQENEDGSYTVRFPGAPETPITVQPPTDAELMTGAESSKHGIWVSVLEKAYGRLCSENFSYGGLQSTNFTGTTILDSEGADGGSINHAGLQILTGKPVNVDDNWTTSEDTMHERLTASFEAGLPVTAFRSSGGTLGAVTGYGFNGPALEDEGRMQTNHEYAVAGYDPENRVITIVDQQMEVGDNGRIYKLPLSEFSKKFSGLAYAEG